MEIKPRVDREKTFPGTPTDTRMIPTDHGAESVHDRPTEGTTVTDEKDGARYDAWPPRMMAMMAR